MGKLYSSVVLAVILCLGFVNKTNAVTYFFVGTSGSQITDLHAWNTSSTASVSSSLTGANPASFGLASTSWSFATSSPLTLATTWSVALSASVTIGDGTNALNFTMASGAVIGTVSGTLTSQPKITVANAAILTLNTAVSFNSTKTVFSSGSTVIYDTGSGPSVPNISSYSKLIINTAINLNGTSFSVGSDLTVNAALDLQGANISVTGNVILNSNITLTGGQVTISGHLSGSGTFTGDNTGSSLFFNGTGNIGTLTMASPFKLSSLTMSLSLGSSTLTLGSDLDLDGGSSLIGQGSLNLNGHLLESSNGASNTSVVFSGAVIMGSSSSALSIVSQTVTGTLTMDATANTLKSLSLNSSGQTLTLGNSLKIADNVAVEDGTIAAGSNLTLLSTSALHGRVGVMGATGFISGNVTVQIFAPGGFTGWAELGAGGVSGETIASWDGQFPMTCTGCTNDPASVGGFYSIQGYNEPGLTISDPNTAYDTSVNSGTPLTPAEGFWVYLGTGSSTTGDIIINNTGPLVQGQITTTITNSAITGDPSIDGFCLVSNPYASPISLDALYNFNGQGANWAGSVIHIWNADLGDQIIQTGTNFIIPAGQGFYVQAFSPVPAPFSYPLTFDESMKTADNGGSNSLMRTAATQSAISGFKLNIAGSNGDADKTLFQFNSGATVNYDNLYDANKMFSTPGYYGTGPVYSQYTSISSVSQNHKYAINTLPVLTTSISVPVLVRVSTTGTYSISISDIQGYNSCTILKDKLTGQYYDLANGPYVCTIADTTSAPRFELVLCEMASPTSVKQLNAESGSIQVIQDNESPVVITHFPKSTKATISVFNIVGQQLISNQVVEGKDTNTRLNLNSHNEVLLIKVTTDTETVTKKIITH